MTSWSLLRHPETGGVHLVPAGSEEPFEQRGWVRDSLPEGLDADEPDAPSRLDEALAAEREELAKRALLAPSDSDPTPDNEDDPDEPGDDETSKAAKSATDKKE